MCSRQPELRSFVIGMTPYAVLLMGKPEPRIFHQPLVSQRPLPMGRSLPLGPVAYAPQGLRIQDAAHASTPVAPWLFSGTCSGASLDPCGTGHLPVFADLPVPFATMTILTPSAFPSRDPRTGLRCGAVWPPTVVCVLPTTASFHSRTCSFTLRSTRMS